MRHIAGIGELVKQFCHGQDRFIHSMPAEKVEDRRENRDRGRKNKCFHKRARYTLFESRLDWQRDATEPQAICIENDVPEQDYEGGKDG